MMVKQTRHIFDLTDIKAVRFRCSGCGGELVQSLSGAAIPTVCPSPACDERWAPAQSTASDTAGLIEYARKVLLHPDPKMTVRFEIDGEEEG